MEKKLIKFSKGFLPCGILSIAIIALGLVGFFTRGINFGIDFKPGSIIEVTIASEKAVTIEDVRSSMESIGGTAVKEVGTGETAGFQIRVASSDEARQETEVAVINTLKSSFGEENVNVIKRESIASNFSKSLAKKSVVLLIATVALIWLYAAFRFHWDFALGAIIALLHDGLIMMAFIIWTRMEFTTTVLAAILTIVGYSINDTVVILDRVRSNLRVTKVTTFNGLLDRSLSDTFGRSVITTVTTLFAVVSLYIFTTGSIKDFALALIVGLISGCYSSIFISSGFISLFRKNWKPEYGVHHSLKNETGVLQMDGIQI